jgi:hypothetical protein
VCVYALTRARGWNMRVCTYLYVGVGVRATACASAHVALRIERATRMCHFV